MDIEDLKFMIAQGEGYLLEFKESFSDSIAKEICAFANAKGGKVLIGVSDDGEIRDFFKDENLIGFDDKINKEFDLNNDLDEDRFNRFIEITKISPVIKKERILENLGLIKDGFVKNAGVLLFCQKITKFFLSASISCFLYMGTSKYKILDKKEFDQDILSNYNHTINYIMSHLNTEYIIKNGPRDEKLELPGDALREAILNAIAHRDYFSTSNIHVNIFKNRVEIINPGGLIGNLSIEDIYEKSIPRNPLLFGIMERMELIERAGSGLVRIEKAMEDYMLEKPIIKADKNWFQITFLRPELQVYPYEFRIRSAPKREYGE